MIKYFYFIEIEDDAIGPFSCLDAVQMYLRAHLSLGGKLVDQTLTVRTMKEPDFTSTEKGK